MLSKPKHPHCLFKDCKYSENLSLFRKIKIKFAVSKIRRIFAVLFREHSSVGLEHLPYKQRVGGSTPSAPTKSLSVIWKAFFVHRHIQNRKQQLPIIQQDTEYACRQRGARIFCKSLCDCTLDATKNRRTSLVGRSGCRLHCRLLMTGYAVKICL